MALRNRGLDYGIVIHDHPFAGSPDKCAITTYLAEIAPDTLFVVQRDSTQESHDDLRLELYQDCKQGGETWYVPSTRYNICCKGLGFLSVETVAASGVCAVSQDLLQCSACGNGSCEAWENVCNCPKDCPGPCGDLPPRPHGVEAMFPHEPLISEDSGCSGCSFTPGKHGDTAPDDLLVGPGE